MSWKFKVGDKVITVSGINGTIVSVTEQVEWNGVSQPILVKFNTNDSSISSGRYNRDGRYRHDIETAMDIRKLTKLEKALK